MTPDDPAAWDATVDAYRDGFEPFVLKFGRAALAALAPPPDARLLDLAAGTGGLALEAAAAGLAVTAVDFSPASIRCLRRRADDAGIAVTAAVMDGGRLALPAAAMDAVVSVFGHMFFPNRAAACAEVLRVLRPGARFATVVWGAPDDNESQILMRDAAAAAGLDLSPKGPPPAWAALCAPAAAATELRAAGFAGVEERTVRQAWDVPSAAWLAAALPGLSPVSAALFGSLSTAEADRLLATYRALAEDRHGTGPFALHATARIVTARRP